MELASELRRALDGLCAIGAPEVRENGEWLAGLEGVQYEVRAQGEAALLHLWSAQQSLVRRVLRVAEESADRVVLEVSRFGYSRHAQLEFVAGGLPRETRRVEREQFSSRLRRILTDHFPDESVEWLATSADLRHSISGCYTRGLVRRIARSNAGNLATWIVPRREFEQAIAAAMPLAERIRRLAPEAIRVGVAPATQEVTLRFRGLEFARWRLGAMWYGLGDRQEVLTPEKWPALEALVRQLETQRHPLASDTKHRLYRAQPERWLETMVAADPARIDARLDPKHIYTQLPAFSTGDRGIIDLLGVTRAGRLAVLELKAAEDIQLVMQAVDYWLRVRFHLDQDDFSRYGYFPEVRLNAKPPLLFLVAPGFRFHPSIDIVLRYLSPEIEIARIALAENWRRGLHIVFRQ